MPTIITHAAVGVALAQVGPAALSRKRLSFSLAVFSVIPDLDVVAFHFQIPYSHWLGHRGFSHSLLFALVVAAVVARLEFRKVPLDSRDRWRLFVLCALAIGSHGILDAFTDGGLGIGFLLPFASGRYFFPFHPLVVSPIGLGNFLGGPALAVLSSEALYVWLPIAALSIVARRRRRVSRGEGP